MKCLRSVWLGMLVLALAGFSSGIDPGGLRAARAAAATPTPAPSPTVADALSALGDLDSYRSTLHVQWKGTKSDNTPSSGFVDVKAASVRDPYAYRADVQGQESQGGQEIGKSEYTLVEIGDNAWYYHSQVDQWSEGAAGSYNSEAGGFFFPAEVLRQLPIGAIHRASGRQTVGGVECQRHTFTEKDMQQSDQIQVRRARGEVCLAVDGDYLVKMTANADLTDLSASASTFMATGNMIVNFGVSDVNQPIDIVPPVATEQPTEQPTEQLTEVPTEQPTEVPTEQSTEQPTEQPTESRGFRPDIPLLPDAQVDSQAPGFITYRTAMSVEDAGKFYQEEMPKQGWEAGPNNQVVALFTYLTYTRGGETASMVIAGVAEQETYVTITVVGGVPYLPTVSPTEAVKTPTAAAAMHGTPTRQRPVPTKKATATRTPKPPTPTPTPEVTIREDVPLLPDAKLSPDSTPDDIIYTTATAPADAGQFYETEMPNQGWEASPDNDFAANGYLEFTKDNENAYVYVYAEGEGSQVEINILSGG